MDDTGIFEGDEVTAAELDCDLMCELDVLDAFGVVGGACCEEELEDELVVLVRRENIVL